MSDEKQQLSYEEFAALLKGSVALQARKNGDRYSKEDLLAAAREPQIDSAVAAELVDTYIARRGALSVAPRPFDTRIRLSAAPDRFELTIPPLRVRAATLAPLVFVAFWLGFTALWTRGVAQQESNLFAVFSIPFWAAGIGMAFRFVKPLVQTISLTLTRESGTLRGSPLGRTRTLRTSEVRARIGEFTRYRHEGASVELRPAKAVLLEHGTETLPLLDGYSEQEQRWIESELQAWLLRSNPTGVGPG